MFCPNCGMEQVGSPKFCPSCGTKLVQESVNESDIEHEIKPSVEPTVNQRIQPKSRSVALKWGTGLLFVIVVIYLIGFGTAIAQNIVPSIWDWIAFIIVLAAAIYAVKRKYWGVVLTVVIVILVTDIIITSTWQIPRTPVDIAWQTFLILVDIACLILISKTKAEFS